jgi:hypothetical protein
VRGLSRGSVELIEQDFPDQGNPEEFVEAHRDTEKTGAFADFFQLLIDTGDPQALDDKDAKFTVTFGLSFWERLKILLTGKYDAMIGPLLTESVGFGICWQHQDILETLRNSVEEGDV